MATAELLAKIDELDRDYTLPLPAGPRAASPAIDIEKPSRRWLALAATGVALFLLGLMLSTWMLEGDDKAPATISPNQLLLATPTAAGNADQPLPEPGAADEAARLAAAEAQERQRSAKFAEALRIADENAARKAEKQRKAKEEEQVRLAQEQQERRQQEEARLRAEQEAAEHRARSQASAAPRAPTSPQELCAAQSNFFTRGLCEVRACGRPEWQAHPYCVKRMEEQLRRLGQPG